MPDWLIDLSANKFNNSYFRDANNTGFAVDGSNPIGNSPNIFNKK